MGQTFTGGIGTGDPGMASITQPMEPLNYPQVPVVEQKQSPVVPAIMTRPTGDMMSLPQSKPTPEELYQYNFGTSGVPDTTGTNRLKTPQAAINLGQDPLTVTGQQEMTPAELAMLQGGLERVDEPQFPTFEQRQSPVVPAIMTRPTGQSIALPTPADEVSRLRDAEEMRRQDELRRQAEEADRAKAEQQAAADAARIAEDAARAKERREAQDRARAAETARLEAAAKAAEEAEIRRQDEIRKAAEDAEKAKAAAVDPTQTRPNKHGFKDERVRDDQGTATKVENNQVYYSDDHDWSKPTQTTVKEEKDDSGSDNDGCFVKGTPITMKDGSIKPVEEVDIGDEVMLGGFVFAAGRFLVDAIYDYEGIQVSGTHMVLEDGAWVRVKDSRKGKFISDEDTIVYIFGSENRRIMINDTVFTDYFEVTEQERLLDTGDNFFDNWRENGAKESEENMKIRNEELVKKTSMAA